MFFKWCCVVVNDVLTLGQIYLLLTPMVLIASVLLR